MPSAATTSRTFGNWSRSSSGIRWRVALYSSNRSWRNVGAPRSKAIATASGFTSWIARSTMLVKPKTAFTSSPFDVVRGVAMSA